MSMASYTDVQKMRAVIPACRMAYSADEHGWSAGAFHAQVDTFGAAVVLATSAGGAVFGAYNPRGWIGESCEKPVCYACIFLVLHAIPCTQVRQHVSGNC